jgi:hypothetical protein
MMQEDCPKKGPSNPLDPGPPPKVNLRQKNVSKRTCGNFERYPHEWRVLRVILRLEIPAVRGATCQARKTNGTET